MNETEQIKKITEYWFLTEPLLFAAFCSHTLLENSALKVPFRTGQRRIEYSAQILNALDQTQIEEYLKVEVIRILLKHPYQRLPPFPNKKVLAYASNITIADCHPPQCALPGVGRWPLPQGLCFEEYYNAVFAILCVPPQENGAADETVIPPENGMPGDDDTCEQISELWQEDDEMFCDINNMIEVAQASSSWGTLSGQLQGVIVASMQIQMDYRKMLGVFRTSILSSKRRLTRMRPSRRFGFAFMGSRYQLASRLLIAVDVSGSVTDKSLRRFFSVINRFFKYGIETLDVIQFDHDLKTQKPLPLKKARREVKIIGRGGTSFQPAADYFCAHPEYDGLIYFTDGQAPAPTFNTKRPIDVLWILTSKKEYEQSKSWISKLPGNRATYMPT